MNLSSLLTLAKDAGGTVASVASSFLPSPWLILAAAIAIGGSYFYGRHDGIPAGKQEVQDAYNKQLADAKADFDKQLADKQNQINQLVSDNNARVEQQNTRIATLETNARVAADQYAALQAQREKLRKQLLDQWKTSPVATTCAVDKSTSSIINQMLDVK